MPTTWSRPPAHPRADWRGQLATVTAWTALVFSTVMVGLAAMAEPRALPAPVALAAALATLWLGWPVTQPRADYSWARYWSAIGVVCALPALIVVLALARGDLGKIALAAMVFAGVGAVVAVFVVPWQLRQDMDAAQRSDH